MKAVKLGSKAEDDHSHLFYAPTVEVEKGVWVLQREGVVAFPTDTLYGLGADFASQTAIRRVLDIKGRPHNMGMPLLLAGPNQLKLVAKNLSTAAWTLLNAFWPGALTLVVPSSSSVPYIITGGRDSVAVRVPNHPVPRALARGLGRPITGTSANVSGQPPATTAAQVGQQLGGSIDLVIDGGMANIGIPSTIVDVTGPLLRVIRTGAVSISAITEVLRGQAEIVSEDHTSSQRH